MHWIGFRESRNIKYQLKSSHNNSFAYKIWQKIALNVRIYSKLKRNPYHTSKAKAEKTCHYPKTIYAIIYC